MKIGLYPGGKGGIYTHCMYLSKYTEAELIEKKEDIKDFDIVHIHGRYPFFIDKPLIQTFHDLLPFKYADTLKKKAAYFIYYLRYRRTLNKALKIIAISNFSKELLKKVYGLDSIVIPNGVDTKLFRPLKKKEYFCYCGALDYHKNFGIVLEALKLLKDDTEVKVTGDGPFREKYEREVEKYALNVRFYGWVDYKDVAKIIGKARALIQPEVWAGFGVQIIEAFACKTPVLASDIPAHRELKYCSYFDPNDVNSLVRLMKSVPKDSIQNAYKLAQKLDWKNVARKVQAVYDEVKLMVK
ncbi:MAG: glycosyltransferase family 1 protein [Candidatus Aenigmarchaeota archaeon]|nr:glycosyltransferase family 1 protein [Candidatus Aenigmarchaeota archaeon]